jgi:tRNA (cytosine38-C5)-methyltransferase
MLQKLVEPPRWIFLENVKTFQGSDTLQHFEAALQHCGYSWQCFLLSPRDFGIPNHRTRFYMICERGSSRFQQVPHEPLTTLSREADLVEIRPLSDFLLERELSEEVKNELRLSDHVLGKTWSKALSVVGRLDRTTFCFTKAYGKSLHKASGSFLYEDAEESYELEKLDRTDMLLHSGRIRMFHPRELLNLFGFPDWFSFPEGMVIRDQFKLIGNSVNVTVVRALLQELLLPSLPNPTDTFVDLGAKGE